MPAPSDAKPATDKSDFVHLHSSDNVVVLLKNITAGDSVQVGSLRLTAKQDIAPGHKLALSAISQGQPITKFGWPIGVATRTIEPGEHVHSHNLQTDHKIDLEAISTEVPATPTLTESYTFQGYRRENGKVGTRNFIAVISNVNCSASVARMIADQFDAKQLAKYPNVHGVISFRHEHGCAMAWDGIRHRMLADVLGGMAKHVNIGGYLLVGLGCEQATLDHLVSSQGLHQIQLPQTSSTCDNQVPTLSIQSIGGTRQTVERGVAVVEEMLPRVNAAQRSEVPASELTLALECGGSDGYSGITANPVLGIAADMLVASGGTAILSETAEIYGAEHLLTRRARSREVAEKLLERLEWWRWYCSNYGEEFDSNPSVGNKAGGLTTITEKSLGAVSKAGSTALEAVYDYAKPVDKKGFVVMDSPGFDPASVTGMVAGGANLVAFTTGRGSCFGFKPAPSFKIASNSNLYQRLPEDMDFNAGQVLEGRTLQEVGEELFRELLDTASGKETCSEKLGIGDEEFVPWLVGPVL
ncbi:MAG: altronate dehydratase family protein [Planctomycetota bacterium]|nr:altronate dehydratase family protein [Planctomycetota bacterium]